VLPITVGECRCGKSCSTDDDWRTEWPSRFSEILRDVAAVIVGSAARTSVGWLGTFSDAVETQVSARGNGELPNTATATIIQNPVAMTKLGTQFDDIAPPEARKPYGG
jgi:hypothetical protein